MDEPVDRRSNRSSRPKIHFDDIVQSSSSSKPSNAPKKPSTAPKKPFKTSKSSTKPPITKSSKTPLETLLDPPILDPIKELCSQTAKHDIKAKKKAKSGEISCLKTLGFYSILKEIKPLKEIEYEPLILRNHQAPKVNILSDIDASDPLDPLDL
jgi:hypothetical protein